MYISSTCLVKQKSLYHLPTKYPLLPLHSWYGLFLDILCNANLLISPGSVIQLQTKNYGLTLQPCKTCTASVDQIQPYLHLWNLTIQSNLELLASQTYNCIRACIKGKKPVVPIESGGFHSTIETFSYSPISWQITHNVGVWKSYLISLNCF